MPQYTVRAPDGRAVTLTGDAPPNEADLDEIFSQVGASARKPASAEDSMPDLHSLVQRMVEGNESEEDIAAVIRHYRSAAPSASDPASGWTPVNEPDLRSTSAWKPVAQPDPRSAWTPVAEPTPASPPQTLAQMVRAKYVGAYDDLTDQELEAKVRAKHPGAYDDLPSSGDPRAAWKPVRPEAQAAKPQTGILSTLGDVAKGAIKGVGQTVTNLGALVHQIPGVDTAVDALYGKEGLSKAAFAAANEDLAPTNTAQKVGKFGEQIAEVVLPGKAVTLAGKGLSLGGRMALEGAANAGMAKAQGGDPLVAGAMGALLPGAGALAGKAAHALRGQAGKEVAQALGATSQRYKAMADRLTPEILKRGLRGSREDLQARAADAAGEAGQRIDDAIQQFGDRRVGTRPIVAALEEAKNAFRTVTQQPMIDVAKAQAKGVKSKVLSVDRQGIADVLHEFEPRALRQLDELQNIITGLGDEARADQLIAVRRSWDKVVDQAGGFAHRAPGGIGLPLKDATEAAAKREATTAIRKQLDAAVPELSGLNKEFAFWKNLDSVLTQTLQRTQPQRPGLGQAAAKIAGHAVGGALGSGSGPIGAVAGAIVGGKLNAMLEKTFTGAAWKLASAQAKDRLASAIVANDANGIAMALARITAAQGSKIPAAVSR
jgi:hypothetical protein